MPNHVTHTMHIEGPPNHVSACVDRIIKPREEGDDPRFDFSSLIPMPESLEGTVSGGHTDYGLAILGYSEGDKIGNLLGGNKPGLRFVGQQQAISHYLSWPWVKKAGITTVEELVNHFLEEMPDCLEQGKRALANFKEHGYISWYEWCIAKWGTKWGAYSFHEEQHEEGLYRCKFDTAWSPPFPVFDKLVEEFPELTVEIESFDEGWNFACNWTFSPEEGSESEDYEGEEAMKACYERVYGHPHEEDEEE